MAVLEATRMWSRQGGAISSKDGKEYAVSFSDAYQVVHDKNTLPLEILQYFSTQAGLPWIGDNYPGLDGVYCTDVGEVETVGPILSVVNVAYGGETGPTGNDPLTQAPKITRRNAISNEPVDEDDNGLPLCNTVGDPVQGLTSDVSDMILTVERNFATYNTALIQPYFRSVSSDAFDQWAPGQCKLMSLSAEEVSYGTGGIQTYQKVRAEIHARHPFRTIAARAWWKRFRNEGLRKRVGPSVTFDDPPPPGPVARATGYPITSSAGVITGLAITSPGYGYPPNSVSVGVTVNDAGGGGSGASINATTNANGLVTGFVISNGGTGYHSRVVKATDSDGDPVDSPVMLDAAGFQIVNSDLAVWNERPVNVVPLPYAALGLL